MINNPLIYGGICFLLGVLVTAIIYHFLSKDRERQLHKIFTKQEAAQKFRAVIAKELALLTLPDDRFPMSSCFDNSHVVLLHTAVIEFDHSLDPIKKTNLAAIWTAFNANEKNRGHHEYKDDKRYKKRIELLKELLSLTE